MSAADVPRGPDGTSDGAPVGAPVGTPVDTPAAGSATPSSVLFVCVHNSGKSQIAAAVARRVAPGVRVDSAGTDPAEHLHAGSVATMAEVGVRLSGRPQALTPELVEAADVVVVLGTEARVTTHDGTPVLTWAVDEPSLRGIEGDERMRLVRDDITARVRGLLVPGAAG